MSLSLPAELEDLMDKPVAIFGAGMSGHAAYTLVKRLGRDAILYDEDGAKGHEARFGEQEAEKHRLIIVSPGFGFRHPWISLAKEKSLVCIGELDFASSLWDGKLIAVTGTNGKTTVTEFLATCLKKAGHEATIVGNIGIPFSEKVLTTSNEPDSFAVCEVSSFQSESLNYLNPDALIWTNISEDHLDHHLDMKNYFDSKWNLVRRLNDEAFFMGESVKAFAESHSYVLPDFAMTVRDESEGQELEGPFNLCPQRENYFLVKAFWESQEFDISIFRETAKNFILPAHRLHHVRTIGGIHFWNDSKATNFASALAALRSFEGEKVYWIAGGSRKGVNVESFARSVESYIDSAFLVGEAGLDLEKALQEEGARATYCGDIEKALMSAIKEAKEGGIVLLSPGFASFDQFSNYIERGNFFEKIVLRLKEAEFPISYAIDNEK